LKNHIKKSLIALFFILLFNNMHAIDSMVIPNEAVFIPSKLGALQLLHQSQGFMIKNGNNYVAVQKHDMDQSLREMNFRKLNAMIESGYISVNQFSDGSYGLKYNVRGPGGGPIGAVVCAAGAKAGVHIAAQCVYYGIWAVVVPFNKKAADAAYYGAQACCAMPVDNLSNRAAVAGGFIGMQFPF
jgi:hypothetical protein